MILNNSDSFALKIGHAEPAGNITKQWSRRPEASATLPLPGAAHRQR
jgi:hypothetical protein